MNYLEIFNKEGEPITIEEVLSQANLIDFSEVSRVEAIDKNGRAYVNWFDNTQDILTISMQDEGRTSKVFVWPLGLEG